MYLVFDGVSSKGYIGVFSGERVCISEENFQISGNESSMAVSIIDDFLEKNSISYSEVQNIVSIVGPGSFTGVRTISLIVNTIAFIHPHIHLTPVIFFDLYDSYPIVKSSSKRDLFVKWSKTAKIEIVSNDDFEKESKISTIFGDTNLDRFEKEYHLDSTIDYEKSFKEIKLDNKKQIAPLYIKKPNIS